jgi:uncharacterized protein YjdB
MKRCCLLLGVALTIAGCSNDTGPSSLSSVVITGDSTVGLNGTLQLTATALAGNVPVAGLMFVWISSDSTNVRVSQTGLVTGVHLGSASITAVAVPAVSAPVTSDPLVIRTRIARIVFAPFDIAMTSRHDTLIVSADARDAQNTSVPGIPFTWSSGNTGIVTVADSGLHKAIVAAAGYGTARIVATADGVSDSLTATVQQVPATVAIMPTSFSTLTAFGRSVQATCIAVDSAGDTIPNHLCNWSVLSAGVVSVNPATAHTTTVTAVGNGTASIQAQAIAGVAASQPITVKQVPKTILISPANFGTPDVTMKTNQSAPFFAAVFDSLDHPALEDSVTWTSSDSTRAAPAAAATLDSTLITTFAATGAATITATAGPASATRVVNVSASPVSFATDVQPIFNTSTPACTSCHPSAAGMDLTAGSSYANIVNQNAAEVPAMKRVRPFMPDSSYLVHKIQGTQNSVGGTGARMPLGCSGNGCLSNASINLIRNWILQGALQN